MLRQNKFEKIRTCVQSFGDSRLLYIKRGRYPLVGNYMIRIDACKQGDRRALGELYAAYSRKLLGICRYYVKDESVVEDILHDAFIIIFSSISTLKDEAKLEGWMITIVRNLCLKHLQRAEGRENLLPLVNADALPDESHGTNGSMDLATLLDAIESLPNGHREVFKLAVLDGLSHKEIGELLGIAPHSSSSQLSRAKKLLRTMLTDYWLWLLLPVFIPVYLYLITRHGTEKISENQQMKVDSPKKEGGVMKDDGAGSRAHDVEHAGRPVIHNRNSGGWGRTGEDNAATEGVDWADSTVPRSSMSTGIDSLQRHWMANVGVGDSLFRLPTIPSGKLIASNEQIITKRKQKYPWTFGFGHSSNAATGSGLSTLNYLTVTDYANGGAAAKLYTWNDYMDYLQRNSALMDSAERANLKLIAEKNFQSDDHVLGEKAHHHRPVTFGFSLNKQLSPHWIFGTGLNYTGLKSDFTSEFNGATLKKTQKISYIGIPLRLTYRIWGKGRFNAYATGGVTFELPVHSSFKKKYIVTPDSSYTLQRDIHPRNQWSVNLGVGVQYRLFKPFSLYLEPNMFYYFNNGSDLETYRTEHPFTFTVPFGLRLTW